MIRTQNKRKIPFTVFNKPTTTRSPAPPTPSPATPTPSPATPTPPQSEDITENSTEEAVRKSDQDYYMNDKGKYLWMWVQSTTTQYLGPGNMYGSTCMEERETPLFILTSHDCSSFIYSSFFPLFEFITDLYTYFLLQHNYLHDNVPLHCQQPQHGHLPPHSLLPLNTLSMTNRDIKYILIVISGKIKKTLNWK